jgi:hypothetical protein
MCGLTTNFATLRDICVKTLISAVFGCHSPLHTKSLVIYCSITNKMFQLIMVKKLNKVNFLFKRSYVVAAT